MKKGTAKLRAAIRRRRFIRQYVTGGPGVAGNAAQAVIAAGLASSETYAKVAGSELLKSPQTQAAILAAMDRAGATEERIMQELSRIALGDHRDVAEWGPDWHRFVPSRLLDNDSAATVQGVESLRTERVTERGVDVTHKLRLQQYSKVEALALLVKVRGMVKYRMEHSGPDGAPIEMAVRFYLPAPARLRVPSALDALPAAATNGAAYEPPPAGAPLGPSPLEPPS